MDSFIDVTLLALLQGVAEFLPISSSGHLVLGKHLLGMREMGMRLDIFLHVGTLAAVCLFYFATIRRVLLERDWKYMGAIVLSAVPAGVVGVLFKDQLEALFSTGAAVGWCLVFTGAVLCLSRYVRGGTEKVGFGRAFLMGLAQAVAILPGVSRSGMTLAAAHAAKVDPVKAAEFSFLMSSPPIAGAALLETLKLSKSAGLAETGWALTLYGMVLAGVAGYFALVLLVRLLRGSFLWLFGPYCIAAGGAAIAFMALPCTAADGASGAPVAAARAAATAAGSHDYPIHQTELTNAVVTGGFWLPRFETNRTATVRADFGKCEEWRIPNFTNAAVRAWGCFKGIPYDDSDVYKVIEGAAYAIAQRPDPALENYCDALIAQIARAQEPDGYLYTARTLGYPPSRNSMMGPVRWSNLGASHELYNVGHMYEAAIAYLNATGKRTLFDVAIRSADLVCRTFGYGQNQLRMGPGHQEIELALVKLYRKTGDRRYLDQAKFFLDVRGKEWNQGKQIQAHAPVLEQDEPVGHAVRAFYMYCGMADVAALTGDEGYVRQTKKLWDNIVSTRLYLHGAVGRQNAGEGFSYPYDLPNGEAYCETCSSIANALFNERLFRTYGDAKFMDLFELTVYNGFLSGVSFSGDRFFYTNPLSNDGTHARVAWFGTPCCPVNVVRFIPQIPSYAFATKDNTLYWNLFLQAETRVSLDVGEVKLSQTTAYPFEGRTTLSVTPPAPGARFAIKVRIPGWTRGIPAPGGLYTQTQRDPEGSVKLAVNGTALPVTLEKGYATIDRAWQKGDRVTLDLPMGVKRVKADFRVRADRGRLAVMRGPLLYCAEGVDNGGKALNRPLAAEASFEEAKQSICGQDVIALKAGDLTLVPYYAWANRGKTELETWFPEKEPQLWSHVTPIATVSPDFSIWCWQTSLTRKDGLVSYRNKADKPAAMPLSIVVTLANGSRWRVVGAEPADVPELQPVAGEVRALTTRFDYATPTQAFTLSFMQPFLGDEIDALSRPVTYVTCTSDRAVALTASAGKSPENDRLKVTVTPAETRGCGSVFALISATEPEHLTFMGRSTPSWWARDGKTRDAMLAEAVRDYPRLKAKADRFDADFDALCRAAGGRAYAQVAAWAVRQSLAACRASCGPDGELFYSPRENGSGEMIDTVDVIYPQFPHLLLQAPQLARAVLAPVMRYAASSAWPYPYAPHDVGIWPRADGQKYGMKKDSWMGNDDAARMPVEESGNMLVMLAALARAEGNADFAGRWWPMVTKWVNYLEKFGFDPGSQLCTDDFAGRLAHNANLSIKTIMAFASYAELCAARGDAASAAKYRALAKESAAKWRTVAKGGRHGAYRLAFDRPDTWSMKYNLAWDRFMGFNLFPAAVAEAEMACYRKEMCKFGLPLDSRPFGHGRHRMPHTKHDWALWCGVLTGKPEDVEFLAQGTWRYLNAMLLDRPFSDWTFAVRTEPLPGGGFFARSVVGGVLFPALDYKIRHAGGK